MNVKIKIPYYLRQITGSESKVKVEGNTVIECLKDLVNLFPDLEETLFDGKGELQLRWLIYIDDKPALNHKELSEPVTNGAVISIIPIVAGG